MYIQIIDAYDYIQVSTITATASDGRFMILMMIQGGAPSSLAKLVQISTISPGLVGVKNL